MENNMTPQEHIAALSGFLLIAAGTLHLLRLLLQWPLTIGTWSVPFWVSGLAFLLAFGLGTAGLFSLDIED